MNLLGEILLKKVTLNPQTNGEKILHTELKVFSFRIELNSDGNYQLLLSKNQWKRPGVEFH